MKHRLTEVKAGLSQLTKKSLVMVLIDVWNHSSKVFKARIAKMIAKRLTIDLRKPKKKSKTKKKGKSRKKSKSKKKSKGKSKIVSFVVKKGKNKGKRIKFKVKA